MPGNLQTTIIKDFEKGPIRRSLFSNGAVSLFHKAKGFSGAKIQLHFIAGSMFEKESEYGLSHVVEHMIFKEIDTDYIKELEMAGASVNAYTYKENVCFEMSCLSSNVTKLLPTFLRKFLCMNFTEDVFQKEKQVIIKEIKEDADDHETQAIEYIFKKNFTDDLGHSIGGNISQVNSFKRNDLQKYYDEHFLPERMILSIVSGKDNNKVEEILETEMGNVFKDKKTKPFRLKSKNKIAKLNHFNSNLKRKMENSLLVFSFNGPSILSDKFYEYAVLDELLFEGLSSIFFKKLRVEIPLVYGYGSTVNCFSNCGNYVMVFNAQAKDIKEIKYVFKKTMADLSDSEFEASEVESIKKRILDHWEISFDDLEERVEFIAGNEIYQLNEYSIESVRSKIKNVTPKTLKLLLRSLINSEFSSLVLGPK